MTFIVKEYRPDMDMKPFFRTALDQGYIFHTTPRIFQTPGEPIVKFWVVFQDDAIVSVFGTQSFETRAEYAGTQSFSLFHRSCVLKYRSEFNGIITPKQFYNQHQNFMSQIEAPTTFKWLDQNVGTDYKMLLTMEEGKPPPYTGSISMIKNYGRVGLTTRLSDKEWDGRTVQVWTFDHRKFIEQYEQCPKWDVHFPS